MKISPYRKRLGGQAAGLAWQAPGALRRLAHELDQLKIASAEAIFAAAPIRRRGRGNSYELARPQAERVGGPNPLGFGPQRPAAQAAGPSELSAPNFDP